MRVLVAILMAACATGSGLPKPPSPPRTTNLGIDLSGLNLANGLRVVVVHDPHATEIQVTTRYRVGAVDEPDDQRGIAHLVEHLLFQQVIGQETIFAHLENVATSFNGFTSADATTYFARALPSHLDELLAIEGVRMGLRCASVSQAAFEREREVVINELRLHDDAIGLRHDLFGGLYKDGHPYRKFGSDTEGSVRAITRDQACAFADAHYAPGNAVMVVSGNLSPAEVAKALAKYLLPVPSRATAAAVPVEPIAATARDVKITAAVDDPLVMVAWPLPDDAKLRAQARAVIPAVAASIDARVGGETTMFQLGDERAPAIAIGVRMRSDDDFGAVIEAIKRGIAAAPSTFDEVTTAWLAEVQFDEIHQGAIYELYAQLEDGSNRDIDFATELLAGRNPSVSLGKAFQGLRELDRRRAAAVVRDQFTGDRATIVEVQSGLTSRRGHDVALAAPIHDVGLRRASADPSEAQRAAEGSTTVTGAATTRVLANGLKVVLVPQTSVPTVDIRLVFGAGSADDPADKRGAAQLAGHGLFWDFRHINDMLRFLAAAGRQIVSVDLDATTFAAHGLDMHVDLLLSGLRRLVREGRYGDIDKLARGVRNRGGDDFGEAYRVAAYGVDHPYVRAGREIAGSIGKDDAIAFRNAHYTPDNATLIIAGHFDAALADRWIDYLFSDWTGHAVPRSSPPIAPRPAAIARERATTVAEIRIELPATGPRARQLVMAQMLDEIAEDVRHQLGASYASSATLSERRLGSAYVITGSVDASRANEAVELLRTRIAKLTRDADEAARAFVWARSRVLTHLEASTESADSLAHTVARDVVMGRPPLSNTQTAGEVRALTVDAMTQTFAELDLARAIVVMVGPKPEIDPAFATLGREPTYIAAVAVAERARHAPHTAAEFSEDPVYRGEITDALAGDAEPRRLAFGLAAGFATGDVNHDSASGIHVAVDIGFHIDSDTALGVELGAGYLSGSYDTGDFTPILHPISVMPVDVDLFAQVSGYARLWGAAFAGLHLDHVVDDGAGSWTNGIGIGLQGGVDLWRPGRERLGIFGRAESVLGSGTSFAAFSIGVAYHR